MYVLSSHNRLTFKDLDRNSHLAWQWDHVSANLALPLVEVLIRVKEAMKKNGGRTAPWNMASISERKDITDEILERFQDVPWNYGKLNVTRVTIQYIIDNIEKPWGWGNIIGTSPSCKVTEETILAYIDAPWPWDTLLMKGVLPVRFFVENDVPLDLKLLSSADWLRPNLLAKRITDPGWDWEALSKNPRVPKVFRKRYPNAPWSKVETVPRTPVSPDERAMRDGEIARAIAERYQTPMRIWTQTMIEAEIEDCRVNGRVPNFQEMAKSKNITPKFLQKHRSLPWDWLFLQRQGKITKELADSLPHVQWHDARTYPFYAPRAVSDVEREMQATLRERRAQEEMEKKIEVHRTAARKIEGWWQKVAIYDVRYPLARKRFEKLARELGEISDD